MPDIAAPLQLRSQAGILYVNQAWAQDNADGEFFDIGAPLEIPTYTEGITDEIISFVRYGVTNPSGLRRTANEPILTYPAGPNPGSFALGRGKKMVNQSVDIPIQIGPFLIEAETMDLGGLNVDGDPIPDDLVGRQAYIYSATQDPTLGTPIAFAATPAATGEWALGAGRNLKAHATDVGKQIVIFASQRGATNVIEATETPITSVRFYMEYVLTDQRILVVDAPTAIPRPNGDLISGNPVNIQLLFTRNPAICTIGPRFFFKDNASLFLELCG